MKNEYDRKNLTSLKTGRFGHGCAQFTDNGVKVSLNNSTAFHITTPSGPPGHGGW